MIRFVDIRGQGTGYRFAFWDTIIDKFCEFNSEQAWEDANDFEEAFNLDRGRFPSIERFTNLMPAWTAIFMADDEKS
jgi:hypothetical protein